MARFFDDKVDLNWWLDAIERHTGEKIKRLETWGWRNQCKYVYFANPEADVKYGYNTSSYSSRMYLDLDSGEVRGVSKYDLEKELGIHNLYQIDHPEVEVLEVTEGWGGWRIFCRKEIEAPRRDNLAECGGIPGPVEEDVVG